jgi:rod shape-determining protein MreD
MRDLMVLGMGFLLVVLEAALGTVTRLGPLMPNALLPMVIYLGMAPDTSLARGAVLSFALGLMLDSASGHPMGLMTFVHVLTLIGARAGAFRLIMRGRVSQILITAIAAAAGSLIALSLVRILRPGEQLDSVSLRYTLVAVLAPSLATGAIAPFMFKLVRRIDSMRRRDEGASLV